MRKDSHAQVVDHANGGLARHVLAEAGQAEARQPGEGEADRRPEDRRRGRWLSTPSRCTKPRSMVMRTNQGRTKMALTRKVSITTAAMHEAANRPEQGQEALEHASFEGLLGQCFLELDVIQRNVLRTKGGMVFFRCG